MLLTLPRNTVSSIGILYVVVAANYVGDIFSCDLQRLLTRSPLVKQMVVLIGALVWVIEAYDSANLTFAEVMTKTVYLYILFLLSTKSTTHTLLPMLVMIVIDQVLRVWEQRADQRSSTVRRLAVARKVIHIVCVALIVFGCVAYSRKQLRDHGKSFTWTKFFLQTPKCRGL